MDHSFTINQDNIDSDIYYKTLCSSGLAFVGKQQNQIEHKRQNLIDNKQKLLYNNYDSFLKFSDFSKQLINDFQSIETCLGELNNAIPQFKTACETFSNDTRQISNKWNNVSLMLVKYPQLIEFLEIPQLLHNCIRTFYYDDAIKICNFVTKLCSKHANDASIFQNMLLEVDKCKDIMVAQIIKELSGNIQLPVCMKMVKYLRQTSRFTEDQLRINFLTCRDLWFQSELSNDTSNQNYSFNQISRITESFRINIFDIVTQYQAIFPEIDTIYEDMGMRNQIQSKIINSWLLLKNEQYLNILKMNLFECVKINSVLHIDSVIDNCFYFGLSMNKIGADIRPQLILIFNSFIEKRFKHLIEKANKRFTNSVGDIFSKKIKQPKDNAYEVNIENYPILLNYQNDLFFIFNEIRNNVPLSLIPVFTHTLNSSFGHIVSELKSYMKKHEFGLNINEFQNYLSFCHVLRNLLPHLNQSFQKICPISIVSQKLGLTVLEMNKMGLVQSFELDFKNPITEINILIRDISLKLKSSDI